MQPQCLWIRHLYDVFVCEQRRRIFVVDEFTSSKARVTCWDVDTAKVIVSTHFPRYRTCCVTPESTLLLVDFPSGATIVEVDIEDAQRGTRTYYLVYFQNVVV